MLKDAVRNVWALFVGIAILMVGNGLQGSLLGVRANIEGFDTATIGIVMSGYYLGFLVSSIITPKLVTRVGHIRVFAAFASLASASILVHTIVLSPLVWTVLRIISGMAIAGLYVVCESWLNQTATNELRGKIFSIYMMIVSGSLALGQFVLPLADPAGPVLFIFVSICVSMALIPISLSKTAPPTVLQLQTLGIREIYRLSPLGVVGCFLVGVAQSGFLSLGPVFADSIGMRSSQIALFMSLPFIGLLVIQYPLGAVSDRIDRRRVIASAATLAAVASALAAAFTGWSMIGLFAAFAVYGAVASALYGLAIAHANDYIPNEKMLAGSAMLVLTYAAGSFGGPILAGFGMSSFGPGALFQIGAFIHIAIALFALYRMTRRPAIPAGDKGDYVAIAVRTSPFATTAAMEGSLAVADEDPAGDLTAGGPPDAAAPAERGG